MNFVTPLTIGVTLALAWFISPGCLILPGIPVLILTGFWVKGWRIMEPNSDQWDTILDMFAFPAKWKIDKDGHHVFNDHLMIVDDYAMPELKARLGRGGPILTANRYYRKAVLAKFDQLDDWNQVRCLVDTMKDAADASHSPSAA